MIFPFSLLYSSGLFTYICYLKLFLWSFFQIVHPTDAPFKASFDNTKIISEHQSFQVFCMFSFLFFFLVSSEPADLMGSALAVCSADAR